MLLYTDLVGKIVADLAANVRDFAHLDPPHIATLAAPRGSATRTGNLATCWGLGREPRATCAVWTRGRSRRVREVSQWHRTSTPEFILDGRKQRYLILMRLPRMLLRDPLPTIVHELFHIGENFTGELRPMRHGPVFDRAVNRLMNDWLAAADPRLARLARMTLPELEREFGGVLAWGLPDRFQMSISEPVPPPEPYEHAVPRLFPGYELARRFRVCEIPLTDPEIPRVLADENLVLRHYTARGSHRLPPAYRRYFGRGDLARAS